MAKKKTTTKKTTKKPMKKALSIDQMISIYKESPDPNLLKKIKAEACKLWDISPNNLDMNTKTGRPAPKVGAYREMIRKLCKANNLKLKVKSGIPSSDEIEVLKDTSVELMDNVAAVMKCTIILVDSDGFENEFTAYGS